MQQFLGALQYSSTRKEGELWRSLSKKQQNRAMTSYEESLDKKNLISMETIAQKRKKWLTE